MLLMKVHKVKRDFDDYTLSVPPAINLPGQGRSKTTLIAGNFQYNMATKLI